jgi:hypothetical protein
MQKPGHAPFRKKRKKNNNEILEKTFIFNIPDRVDSAPPLPLLPESA